MKTEPNHPSKSKINWTSAPSMIAGVLATYALSRGWIPDGSEEEFAGIVLLALTATHGAVVFFRTWLTNPKG